MILRALLVSTGVLLTVSICRFTVRDVGFVDLGDPGYRCYTFVSEAKSPGVAAACNKVAPEVFADTNIEFAVVDVDDEAEHPAERHLRELKIERLPTTVLVHPDGRAIELPTDRDGDPGGADRFASLLESVASSKLRQRITEAVLRNYCVVLLVEGDDAGRNGAAAQAVQAGFAAIGKVFDKMPKDVGALPVLIALPRSGQAAETVFLWALGIGTSEKIPVVTVLTGRGRQFGPTLDGDDITKDSVLDILAKVGESCECGLDRSWMRGQRVPLRWDADTRQLAVDLLGFDPENPLVKSEISSLLARGVNGQTKPGGGELTVADLLLGYSEESLVGGEDGPTDDSPAAIEGNLLEDDDVDTSGISLWVTLCGLLLASLGTAAYVVLRVKRP